MRTCVEGMYTFVYLYMCLCQASPCMRMFVCGSVYMCIATVWKGSFCREVISFLLVHTLECLYKYWTTCINIGLFAFSRRLCEYVFLLPSLSPSLSLSLSASHIVIKVHGYMNIPTNISHICRHRHQQTHTTVFGCVHTHTHTQVYIHINKHTWQGLA
jgi:hypothetical protein